MTSEMHANARSKSNKKSDIVNFLIKHHQVFLSVSETWLNEETVFHVDAAKNIGYVFFRMQPAK